MKNLLSFAIKIFASNIKLKCNLGIFLTNKHEVRVHDDVKQKNGF